MIVGGHLVLGLKEDPFGWEEHRKLKEVLLPVYGIYSSHSIVVLTANSIYPIYFVVLFTICSIYPNHSKAFFTALRMSFTHFVLQSMATLASPRLQPVYQKPADVKTKKSDIARTKSSKKDEKVCQKTPSYILRT